MSQALQTDRAQPWLVGNFQFKSVFDRKTKTNQKRMKANPIDKWKSDRTSAAIFIRLTCFIFFRDRTFCPFAERYTFTLALDELANHIANQRRRKLFFFLSLSANSKLIKSFDQSKFDWIDRSTFFRCFQFIIWLRSPACFGLVNSSLSFRTHICLLFVTFRQQPAFLAQFESVIIWRWFRLFEIVNQRAKGSL